MAVVNLMKEKSANQMNDVNIEVQPLTVEEVKTKIWEAGKKRNVTVDFLNVVIIVYVLSLFNCSKIDCI